jgi:bacterioferritin-associated ferredoxin
MYICICNAITDKQINKAQSQGYTTMSQITQHLGVGDCCGGCIPAAKELLNDNKVHKYRPALLNQSALAADALSA